MPETRWRRNSIRYPGYDYGQPGLIFVTTCTHSRQRLFGNVVDCEMRLSEPGVAVTDARSRLGTRFPDAVIDEFIVMPDHLHGIIMTGTDPDPATIRKATGVIVNSFKNSVLAFWRKGVAEHGWPRYQQHLWQRAYYDRIIRQERELESLREYIVANPARWEEKRRDSM